jgi:hypothetical protein
MERDKKGCFNVIERLEREREREREREKERERERETLVHALISRHLLTDSGRGGNQTGPFLFYSSFSFSFLRARPIDYSIHSLGLARA